MNEPQVSEYLQEPSPYKETRSIYWRVFGILLFAVFLDAVLNLPYFYYHIELTSAQIADIAVKQIVVALLLGAIIIWLGLRLGSTIGSGAPLLSRWVAGDRGAPGQFLATVPLTLGITVLTLLSQLVFGFLGGGIGYLRTEVAYPLWMGVIGGLGAGLGEEVLYRLGLLTILLWLVTRLLRQVKPTQTVFWTVNILTAILFGLSHLLVAGSLTPIKLITIVLATAIPGAIWGWFYWRVGILQAMLSHVLHDCIGYTLVFVLLAFIK